MQIQELRLNKADDFHVHLRQGSSLPSYVNACFPYFKRILIMPNTLPPLNSVKNIDQYKKEIQSVNNNIEALMTFKLSKNLSTQTIEELIQWGITGGKIYPTGVTTHAEDGVEQIQDLAEPFDLVQNHDIVLNIHAEKPGNFSLHREYDYLPEVQWIIHNFPRLRIVIEHISDRRTIDFIKNQKKNVTATITVHHLMLTLDNVIGDFLSPHNFCKPIPKFPEDLKAIQTTAFSGDSRFFLGTDSAPHSKEQKECAAGCAGVFSSPVAIPLLIDIFEKENKLHALNDFISKFGADFYKLPYNTEFLTFRRQKQQIPPTIANIVPLYANQFCSWRLI